MIEKNITYGARVASAMLKHRPEKVKSVFVVDKAKQKYQLLLNIARDNQIPVETIGQEKLTSWAKQAKHQGIALRLSQQNNLTERDLDNLVEQSKQPPLFLILDGVQDPHNLGACLRTAEAFNITGVIVPKHNAASKTDTVRQISCGAADMIPLITVANLARVLERLKKLGIWIIGTCVDADCALDKQDFNIPVALVLGSEGKGMRSLTQNRLDTMVTIPMLGITESLNVSVTAGICLYEANRQRNSVV